MDTKISDKIVKIFKERILTPILYMIENEDVVDLICFCDRSMDINTMYDTTIELRNETGLQFEIADIREFCEEDRVDIMSNATILYSEDKIIEMIFEKSMLDDYNNMISKRTEMMVRYEENNSPYLQ